VAGIASNNQNNPPGTANPAATKPAVSWRKRLSPSGKWLLRLLAACVIAAVAAVVTVWSSGWLSSSPAAPSLTAVRYIQPFTEAGKLLAPYKASRTLTGGHCTSSYLASDPSALRCISNNLVLDPCWQSYYQGQSKVACIFLPDDHNAMLINGASIKVSRSPVSHFAQPRPWAIEILDPLDASNQLECANAQGATGFVAGQHVLWICFANGQFSPQHIVGNVIGNLQISKDKPWTAFYERRDSSQAVETSVVTVWF